MKKNTRKTTKVNKKRKSKKSNNKISVVSFKKHANKKTTGLIFVAMFAVVGVYFLVQSFGAASFPTSRNVYEWPFAQDSVWNMPIGSKAVYRPAGLKPVTQAKPQGGITVDKKYLALNPNAPVKTLIQGDYSNHPKQPTNNKPNTSAIGTKVRVPKDLTADGKLNGAGAFIVDGKPHEIVEGNRTWIEPSGTNPRVMYSFGAKNLKGNGWEGGPGGGQSGSVGGTIRKGELTSNEPIRHALRLNVWGSRFLSRKNSSGCSEGYRWPAIRADANYNKDPSHKGSYNGDIDYVCMGTLLAIKPDQDLSWITSDKVRKIAEASRDYGMYVVDNTAWDVWGINAEASAYDEVMRSDIPNQDEYYRQLQQLILSLQAVTNNSPSSIGGGGTPRQPLAPCFDDEPNCPLENPPQPTVPSDGGSTGDVEPEGKIERSANFTQGVKVSASSQVSSKFSADKAVDGDETSDSSRWTSERVDGETITIDLGRQESISRIAFISAKNTTKQYKLMVSKDNSNYVMVAQGTTQEGVPTLNDQEFASQTARYIRFQGLTRWNNNYGHSIFEIGAYIDEGAIAADFTLSGVSNGEVVNRWIRVGATPSGVTDGVSFKYYVNGKEVYTAKESPYCLGGTDSKGRCWPFDLKPAGTQGKETFTFTVKMIYDDGSLTRDYTLTRK